MKCVIILAVAVVSCTLAKKCDVCSNPDFMGFGFKPSDKCGCCPWPCCCKCVGVSGGGTGECEEFLDVAFIMDASGSIGPSDWRVAKQFFGDVVSKLTDVGGGQRVAAVTFATNASVQWRLNDDESASMENLREAIDGLDNIGSFTNIAEALELTIEDIFSSGNDNEDVPNVSVLLTDGRSNFRVDEVAAIGERLREKSRTVCIGVTNQVDMEELELICDDKDIFSVNDFGALQSILKMVQNKICQPPPTTEKCFCCCTPEMFWGAGGAKYFSGKW